MLGNLWHQYHKAGDYPNLDNNHAAVLVLCQTALRVEVRGCRSRRRSSPPSSEPHSGPRAAPRCVDALVGRYHRQLWESFESYHLAQPAVRASYHDILAQFFSGEWAGRPKPLSPALWDLIRSPGDGSTGAALRMVRAASPERSLVQSAWSSA